jgi:hypothetical protein
MGPGLRKTNAQRLIGERSLRLVRLNDPKTREWLELADVMSEGRVELEVAGARYFGSTSIILVHEGLDATSADDLARLVEADPHLRLRVTRLARQEALARAMRPLGTLVLEMHFAPRGRGVAITIDVSAVVTMRERALGE